MSPNQRPEALLKGGPSKKKEKGREEEEEKRTRKGGKKLLLDHRRTFPWPPSKAGFPPGLQVTPDFPMASKM
ncbi:hypothetical protein M5K25_014479 [Dendrobium thyrsiflorum]|uniref:Uncharacterized protein n=1 Tax=Dendrobium thyrsiflorum TaxID=117978 RepID=A0ABD0UWU8_DENTH